MDTEYFRNLLLRQRESLRVVVATSTESTKPVELDQTRVGRLSRMDALQSQAMSLQTERRRELQLQQIKAALNRIQADNYGYCLHCEEQILEKRLVIDPCATLCIRCASEKENC